MISYIYIFFSLQKYYFFLTKDNRDIFFDAVTRFLTFERYEFGLRFFRILFKTFFTSMPTHFQYCDHPMSTCIHVAYNH